MPRELRQQVDRSFVASRVVLNTPSHPQKTELPKSTTSPGTARDGGSLKSASYLYVSASIGATKLIAMLSRSRP
jgi:hypothetical protein